MGYGGSGSSPDDLWNANMKLPADVGEQWTKFFNKSMNELKANL